MKERAGRGAATREAGGANNAVAGDRNRLDVRVNRSPLVERIEQLLAHAVGDRGARESLVEEDRSIGNRLIEFRESRMPVLGPLVRMPATHRRDPLTLRY
jgi:hypothetical protein